MAMNFVPNLACQFLIFPVPRILIQLFNLFHRAPHLYRFFAGSTKRTQVCVDTEFHDVADEDAGNLKKRNVDDRGCSRNTSAPLSQAIVRHVMVLIAN